MQLVADAIPSEQIRLLPPHTRDDDLFLLGSEFGEVRSVRALLESQAPLASSTSPSPTPSRNDGDIEQEAERGCKGCGFILYRSREEAAAAIHGLNARGFECSFAKVSLPWAFTILPYGN